MLDRPPPFFIADHLALDFLNSIASPEGVPVEWLRDGRDLVAWLEHANVIAPDVAARFRRSNDQRALNGVAGRAREFRDWLREFVTRRMGKPLTTGAAKANQVNCAQGSLLEERPGPSHGGGRRWIYAWRAGWHVTVCPAWLWGSPCAGARECADPRRPHRPIGGQDQPQVHRHLQHGLPMAAGLNRHGKVRSERQTELSP